jgi:hypothetical protein
MLRKTEIWARAMVQERYARNARMRSSNELRTFLERCEEARKWSTDAEGMRNRLATLIREPIDHLHATFALPDVERATDLLPELVDIVGQFLSADMKPGQYTSIHAQAHAVSSSSSSSSSVSASAASAAAAAAAAAGGGSNRRRHQ